MVFCPFRGVYLSPSLSSCSIDPQGNSSSEDPEDAGIVLPLLSTVRSRAPLLRELDLGSYNVSGFDVHRNRDFSACVVQMPNHEDLHAVIYPWTAQHSPPGLLAEFVVVVGPKILQVVFCERSINFKVESNWAAAL